MFWNGILRKHKVSIFSNFGFNRKIYLNEPLDLFIDIIPKLKRKKKRVLLLLEPNVISNLRDEVLALDTNTFDYILTFEKKILERLPNARLFLYGTTWVRDFIFEDKVFGVSTLIGGKAITDLHKFRHKLPQLLELNFKVSLFFFNSKNNRFITDNPKILNISSSDCKNELFFCQFHIAVENFISENYFTEKLIDCFQTKTVPIYIGCPNISDFFDVKGMFIVSNFNDIIDVLNNLNPSTYSSMKSSINYNYEKSKEFIDFGQRLESKLNDLFF